MQPVPRLPLIISGLSAQPKYACVQCLEFRMVIAKAAGLRRAAARAGYAVPSAGQGNTRAAGHGVDVDDETSRECVEPDVQTIRGSKREVRKRHPFQMSGSPIVNRR